MYRQPPHVNVCDPDLSAELTADVTLLRQGYGRQVGCQKNIAKETIEADADYVVALKGPITRRPTKKSANTLRIWWRKNKGSVKGQKPCPKLPNF